MAEYAHHLIGAEQVHSAGCAMRSAAEDIQRASSNLSDVLNRFTQDMTALVERLEALKEAPK